MVYDKVHSEKNNIYNTSYSFHSDIFSTFSLTFEGVTYSYIILQNAMAFTEQDLHYTQKHNMTWSVRNPCLSFCANYKYKFEYKIPFNSHSRFHLSTMYVVNIPSMISQYSTCIISVQSKIDIVYLYRYSNNKWGRKVTYLTQFPERKRTFMKCTEHLTQGMN